MRTFLSFFDQQNSAKNPVCLDWTTNFLLELGLFAPRFQHKASTSVMQDFQFHQESRLALALALAFLCASWCFAVCEWSSLRRVCNRGLGTPWKNRLESLRFSLCFGKLHLFLDCLQLTGYVSDTLVKHLDCLWLPTSFLFFLDLGHPAVHHALSYLVVLLQLVHRENHLVPEQRQLFPCSFGILSGFWH